MCLFTNRSCYSACIRVLPLYPFDLPSLSSQLHKMTICGRHEMASVQDIKIDEAILVLCLAYYASSPLQKLRRYGFYVSRYGACVILRSILCNGWMDCRDAFHAALCPILLCNGQNIAEYEAYWLMGFPIFFLLWLDGLQKYFSCLCNKRNKAEYEANWLISVPIGII